MEEHRQMFDKLKVLKYDPLPIETYPECDTTEPSRSGNVSLNVGQPIPVVSTVPHMAVCWEAHGFDTHRECVGRIRVCPCMLFS